MLILTQGYPSRADEIVSLLATRGQSSSKKGRPTHTKVPYKGKLSMSSRAIAQRDRAASATKEEKALENAGAADRAAKYNLKKKLSDDKAYQSASKAEQEAVFKYKWEEITAKRFASQQSGRLLQ